MPQPLVAIVNQEDMGKLLADRLSRENIASNCYTHVDTAIPALESKKYDLIFTNYEIAPGENYAKVDASGVIAKIMLEPVDIHPAYHLIVLHMVERTRARTSPNRDTPIIVQNTCDSEKLFNELKAQFESMGCIYFVGINESHLVQTIKQELGR